MNINHSVIVTHSVLHHLNLSCICAVETHISEYLLFINKTVGESGSVPSLLPSILEHFFLELQCILQQEFANSSCIIF